MGLVLSEKGDYDNAMEYTRMSLKIAEASGDLIGVSNCYGNMGDIAYRMGDHEKALEYSRRSLAMDEELGNKKVMSSCY